MLLLPETWKPINPLPIGAPGSLRKIKRVAQNSISTSIKKCEQRVFLGPRTDFARWPVNGNRVTTNLSHRGVHFDQRNWKSEAPHEHLQLATWVQFGLGAVLHHSITPSLHHSITPSLHHSITPSLHHSARPDSRTRTRTKRLVSDA
jgi:hypothetical protein